MAQKKQASIISGHIIRNEIINFFGILCFICREGRLIEREESQLQLTGC
jgi:hypothetical protein